MFFFHVLGLAMEIVMFFEPIKHIKFELIAFTNRITAHVSYKKVKTDLRNSICS